MLAEQHSDMKIYVLPICMLASSATCSFCQIGFLRRLADSALTLTSQQVRYDPSYFRISYPNGDVPAGKGVCTDVVIRAYRKMGVDLQKEVHTDIKSNLNAYPGKWNQRMPDKNIDHRRVPNLMAFFSRHAVTLVASEKAADYLPGDIVCWNLGGSVMHIGLVVKLKSADGQRHLIVHNIGAGQVAEDFLFKYKVVGHYRYSR